MMSIQLFWTLFDLLNKSGFYEDLCRAEGVERCPDALTFSWHHCFVVCNSGMNAKVGEKMAKKCWADLEARGFVSHSTFKHKNKVSAINEVYLNRERYFSAYKDAEDKPSFLQTLPHIGPIIKFHLAKNLGHDCAKPDRHLHRIAAYYGTDTFTLCKHLATRVHLKQNTVDYVLWRVSHLRILRTEELRTSGELKVYWEGETKTEAEIQALKVYWEGSDNTSAAA